MKFILNSVQDFNYTTTNLPLFRSYFDLRINNTYFNQVFDGFQTSDAKLSKRILLNENVNISYDISLTIMNMSNFDIRFVL